MDWGRKGLRKERTGERERTGEGLGKERTGNREKENVSLEDGAVRISGGDGGGVGGSAMRGL